MAHRPALWAVTFCTHGKSRSLVPERASRSRFPRHYRPSWKPSSLLSNSLRGFSDYLPAETTARGRPPSGPRNWIGKDYGVLAGLGFRTVGCSCLRGTRVHANFSETRDNGLAVITPAIFSNTSQ